MTTDIYSTPSTRNPYARVLGEDISIAKTYEDALTLGGLNWDVVTPQMVGTFTTEDGEQFTASRAQRKLIARTDTNEIIATVGGRNTPIQNRDMFGIADAAVQRGAVYDRAGSLDGGNKVFMTFALPQYSTNIGGKDAVSWALHLRNTFDGTTRATASLEATRLVCTNGMTARMNHAYVFNLRHSRNAAEQLKTADDLLKKGLLYVKEFSTVAEDLISTPMTEKEFFAYIDSIWAKPDEDDEKRAYTMWKNRREALHWLFKRSDTNEAGRGTRWAGFNAVTEHLDWGTITRSTGGVTENTARARRQFNSASRGDAVRNRAMELITA